MKSFVGRKSENDALRELTVFEPTCSEMQNA
jgi:hypothetical protein